MPKVYIMCSSPADIELAAAQGDGVFIHPMWVRSFIDSHVWPALAASGRQLAIIDGGVIATGAVGDEIEQSRDEARKRVIGYWCSANYDDVFRAIGVMPLIEDFRADVAARRPIWDRETTRELYSTFVCDASLDDLADRLRLSRSRHVTGVFPNVMSCIRRILPRALISEVATIQPAG
jgi:alkanesulfonate monooxygenase SsuD/methylene tetrahydromethanopterin reductase-like flavin-dependent oxidoreductase (luciferase family)